MSDLTKFLLARIAEDEASARRFLELHDSWAPTVASPARVLAECLSKRRIVEELGSYNDGFEWASGEALHAEQALCALATVFADHPDFNPAWRI